MESFTSTSTNISPHDSSKNFKQKGMDNSERDRRQHCESFESESEKEVEYLKKRMIDNKGYEFESDVEEGPREEHRVEDVLSFYNFEFKEPKKELERIFLDVEYKKLSEDDPEHVEDQERQRNKLRTFLLKSRKRIKPCSNKKLGKRKIVGQDLNREFKEDMGWF